MSKYTTELRYVCEKAAGYDNSAGYNFVDETVTKAAPVIFDFDFPMFDESYRLPLERKILKHYYTREIGAETVGLWKLWLNTRLNEIMPFYNKLYETELIKFNPLYDIDLTRDHNSVFNGREDGKKEGNVHEEIAVDEESSEEKTGSIEHTSDLDQTGTNGESVTTSEHVVAATDYDEDTLNWNYYNDTPQGGVTGLDSLTYLTNATKDTGDKTSTTDTESTTTGTQRTDAATTNNVDVEESTSTEDSLAAEKQSRSDRSNHASEESLTKVLNTEDYLEHVVGKSGGVSYSKLLMEFRDTFLNIDLQIINNLSDLFINLW